MKKLVSTTNVETVSVRITGKVQGVGFRLSTVRQAHSLGVTGWVRNLEEGSVEALLQGGHDRIDQMLAWLRVGRPPHGSTKLKIMKCRTCVATTVLNRSKGRLK